MDDDDLRGTNVRMHIGEAQDQMHVQYEHHALQLIHSGSVVWSMMTMLMVG